MLTALGHPPPAPDGAALTVSKRAYLLVCATRKFWQNELSKFFNVFNAPFSEVPGETWIGHVNTPIWYCTASVDRFARIETDLTVLQWMVGLNLAVLVAVLAILLGR